MEKLLRRIGYNFQDASLLRLALTHRSVSNTNNERLEFLGDAILGFLIAEELYRRFPTAAEGEMSRLRASLVKGQTLAVIASELELGEFMLLGSGELKSGGYRRDSILACTLEALIGAVYLDGGEAACRPLVQSLFASRLDQVSPDMVEKDPKTQLQEYLQARKLPLPVYDLSKVEGEAHSQTFYVECRVTGLPEPTMGEGRSRRFAEQAAASVALQKLSGTKKSSRNE
ncbi:MAG: ribonuclease III [Gammaproteobacteria bacterium]|nr:ribonuclease III [Gammaproteobacteria bacterium]